MNGVVGAQTVSLSNITGRLHELATDGDYEETRPVCVEIAQEPLVVRGFNGAFPAPACHRGSHLDIRDLAGCDDLSILDTLPDTPRPLLFYIEFHQSASHRGIGSPAIL